MSRATAIVVGLCWKNIREREENNEIKKELKRFFIIKQNSINKITLNNPRKISCWIEEKSINLIK